LHLTDKDNDSYFPENDDDEEEKKASADNGKSNHPELDLFTYRSSANHCHKRLYLQRQRNTISRTFNELKHQAINKQLLSS